MPTWWRSTRGGLRPGVLSLAIVGDVAPEHALSCAFAALDGWRTPPPEPLVLTPPPTSRIAVSA